MNEWLSVVILGIVEGLTEFLPVSSTGHLILVNEWVRLPEPFSLTFNIVIQVGAIAAVVLYFWKELAPWAEGRRGAAQRAHWLLWAKILMAMVPAAILGLLLEDWAEATLFNPITVAVALVVYGVALIWFERRPRTARIETLTDLPWSTALLIGLFQCLALVPGTSRSAATILGALALGVARPAAAQLSFFLAVPFLGAAAGYKLIKAPLGFTAQEWIWLATGTLVAFLVAWGVIALFMDWIRKRDFQVFGWYRIVLGVLVLAWFVPRLV